MMMRGLVALLWAGMLAAANAGLTTKQLKITASDGAAEDEFGKAVSISGNYAIVGAKHEDPGGDANAGAAYVYKRTADSAAPWTQVAKLVAGDKEAADEFGISAAISGDYAIVGASKEDSSKGAAYMFKTADGGATWTQAAKLVAGDAAAGGEFGASVAIDGNLAIVGANKANTAQGHAYVFKTADSGATWGSGVKIVASDTPADQDQFGDSVGISGNYAIVGASLQDSNGAGAGAAYVFKTTDSGATWGGTVKIQAIDAAASAFFGSSVAISGDFAIVGAHGEASAAGAAAGAAYVFRTADAGATWVQAANPNGKLVASDAAAEDGFGNAVAISGGYAIVGAAAEDAGGAAAGAAYVYQTADSGATWAQAAKLTATGAAAQDNYGMGVDITAGGEVIVGADQAATSNGAAFIFSEPRTRSHHRHHAPPPSPAPPAGSGRHHHSHRALNAFAAAAAASSKTDSSA